MAMASGRRHDDYCKTENVWAMANAVKKYGKY